MAELFANGARGRLLNSITNVATSVTLRSGQGASFPAYVSGDVSWAVLEQGPALNPTKREIVQITARSSDTFTIARAQQGTSAVAFDAGARLEIRLTKSTLESFRDLIGLNRKFVTGGTFPDSNSTPSMFGQLSHYSTTYFRTNWNRTNYDKIGHSIPYFELQVTPTLSLSEFTGVTTDPGRAGILMRGNPPNYGGGEYQVWFTIPYYLPGYQNNLGTRIFLGLIGANGLTNHLQTLNPSELTTYSMIGIGQEDTTLPGDSWNLYYNHSTSPVSVASTGIPKVVGNLMRLRIWSPTGVPKWYVELIDFDAGNRFFTSLDTDAPIELYFMSRLCAIKQISGLNDRIAIHGEVSYIW